MTILMAVYGRTEYPTPDALLEYLGTIPECSGKPVDGEWQHSNQKRGDLYCTLFRLLDTRIDLPDFHILWLPPLVPRGEDQLGIQRFKGTVADEVLFWASYIVEPVFKSNATYELDTGDGHLIILSGDIAPIKNIFEEGFRAELTLIPPPQ